MKSTLKLIVAVGIIYSALFLAGFTDLPQEHWAYGAVTALSEEGTISGLPDGTFRPDEPVTRSQFVKMLGYRTDGARTDYVIDLSPSHWAYDVLLHSPLRLKDRAILPDEPITREDAAIYIYDCYGNGKKSDAPSVVTKGLDHPTEVGWVYDRGIMTGSDGIDLRLSAGLTRAEAAALIVKARQNMNSSADFVDNVPDEILRRIFNSCALFDMDYAPDTVLTNGQVARAAYRLRLERVDALWYNESAEFEHPYADDLKAMETVLGQGRISADFAEAPATTEDAFAMIAYGVASKIHVPISYGGSKDCYSDAKPANDSLVAPLAFAYQNGIRPFSGGRLRSGTPVTHKVMAAVLLQYDLLWGLQTSVTVDGKTVTYRDEPMRLTGLPSEAEVFQSLPMSVPVDVATLAFVDAGGNTITPGVEPKVNYSFCNDLRDAFASYLGSLCAKIDGLNLTYYPQLVYDCGGAMVLRVRVNSGATESFDGLRTYTASDGSFWAEIPLDYGFFLGSGVAQ